MAERSEAAILEVLSRGKTKKNPRKSGGKTKIQELESGVVKPA